MTSDPVSKHTPGPWHIEERTDMEGYWIAIPAPIGRKVIAEVDTGFDEPWDSMQHANAHLIAAAPDMYSICKELLDWVHGNRPGRCLTDDMTQRLVAAIGKAEGNT
jgi:hypothetical protein